MEITIQLDSEHAAQLTYTALSSNMQYVISSEGGSGSGERGAGGTVLHNSGKCCIQQHTHLDPVTVLTREIEREYQQLRSNNNSVNPLSHSPFIGCFQGSVDLATNSKSIINEIIAEKFPTAETPTA